MNSHESLQCTSFVSSPDGQENILRAVSPVFANFGETVHSLNLVQVFEPLHSGDLAGIDPASVARLLRLIGEQAELSDNACSLIAAASAGTASIIPLTAPAYIHTAVKYAVGSIAEDLVHVAIPVVLPQALSSSSQAQIWAPLPAIPSITSAAGKLQSIIFDEATALNVRRSLVSTEASLPLPRLGTPAQLPVLEARDPHPPLDSGAAAAEPVQCTKAADAAYSVAVSEPQPAACRFAYMQLRVTPAFSDLALQLWPASHAIVDACVVAAAVHPSYIEHSDEGSQAVLAAVSPLGRRVFELGAGTGVASLALNALFEEGAALVTSDLPGKATQNLQYNIDLGTTSPRLRAAALDWAKVHAAACAEASEAAIQLQSASLDEWAQYDGPSLHQLLSSEVLIGADILYDTDLCILVANLVAVTAAAQIASGRCPADTSALLLAATVRNEATLRFFLSECLQAGLEVRDATKACLRPVYNGHVHPALPLLYNSMHGTKAASGVSGRNVETLVLIVSHPGKFTCGDSAEHAQVK